jgi:hypothetical protein
MAAASPTTAFDLIARPEAIAPPWWFIALFVAAGIILTLLAAAALRWRWGRGARIQLPLLALCWWLLLFYATWHETAFASATREAARQGRYRIIEGCLSSFHAGLAEASHSSIADEAWTLGSERFAYGTGNVGFAWHKVEPLGGAVHADSRVQVAFVRDETYRENKILRLIVTPHACAPAPDPGPPA